jgi:hypothetical protein
MAEGKPTKAYLVVERWTAHKEVLVYANTVEEAKQHVRNGTGEAEAQEDHFVNAGISEARRWPKEDRDA